MFSSIEYFVIEIWFGRYAWHRARVIPALVTKEKNKTKRCSPFGFYSKRRNKWSAFHWCFGNISLTPIRWCRRETVLLDKSTLGRSTSTRSDWTGRTTGWVSSGCLSGHLSENDKTSERLTRKRQDILTKIFEFGRNNQNLIN